MFFIHAMQSVVSAVYSASAPWRLHYAVYRLFVIATLQSLRYYVLEQSNQTRSCVCLGKVLVMVQPLWFGGENKTNLFFAEISVSICEHASNQLRENPTGYETSRLKYSNYVRAIITV